LMQPRQDVGWPCTLAKERHQRRCWRSGNARGSRRRRLYQPACTGVGRHWPRRIVERRDCNADLWVV